LEVGWGAGRKRQEAAQRRAALQGTIFKDARCPAPFSKNSIAFQKRLFYIPNQQYA
jgi:hypothetical protein